MEGGDWLKDRFEWKQALGPATDRPGHWNGNWGYWSTDGLRFPLPASILSWTGEELVLRMRRSKTRRVPALAVCGAHSVLRCRSEASWHGNLQGG